MGKANFGSLSELFLARARTGQRSSIWDCHAEVLSNPRIYCGWEPKDDQLEEESEWALIGLEQVVDSLRWADFWSWPRNGCRRFESNGKKIVVSRDRWPVIVPVRLTRCQERLLALWEIRESRHEHFEGADPGSDFDAVAKIQWKLGYGWKTRFKFIPRIEHWEC